MTTETLTRPAPETRIALLRGINIGRAKRIAMADLRRILQELGYGDVRTLLNSGNAVFTGPPAPLEETRARIEEALVSQLGVSSRTTVLTAAEFSAVVAENRLAGAAPDPTRLLVAVTATPGDILRLRPLLDEEWSPEMLALGSRAAYLWCPAGVAGSRLPEAIGRVLRDAVTIRNWATVMKLRSIVDASGA